MWLTDLFDYFKSKPKLVKEDDKVFKLGDKVVAIRNGIGYKKGEKGVVRGICSYDNTINVMLDDGFKLFCCNSEKFELVKDFKLKFKPGDRVVATDIILARGVECTYYYVDKGDLVTVDKQLDNKYFQIRADLKTHSAKAPIKYFELVEDKNMFTKEDIKTGMIVETRGGEKLLKFSKGFMPNLDNPFYGINLSYYREDLTCSAYGNSGDDIVKVYRTRLMDEVIAGNYESLEIVWSRTNTEVDSIKNNIKDMESKLVEMKENLKKLEDK